MIEEVWVIRLQQGNMEKLDEFAGTVGAQGSWVDAVNSGKSPQITMVCSGRWLNSQGVFSRRLKLAAFGSTWLGVRACLPLTDTSGFIYEEHEPGGIGQAGYRNVGRGWITSAVETEISKGWSLWHGYVDVIAVGKTLPVGGR